MKLNNCTLTYNFIQRKYCFFSSRQEKCNIKITQIANILIIRVFSTKTFYKERKTYCPNIGFIVQTPDVSVQRSLNRARFRESMCSTTCLTPCIGAGRWATPRRVRYIRTPIGGITQCRL